MKWIVDAPLPPSLAAALRPAGCDAVAVREIGLREAKDAAIRQYAPQNEAAILTEDEDFAERCLRSEHASVVIWLRIGNATNPVLPRLVPADAADSGRTHRERGPAH